MALPSVGGAYIKGKGNTYVMCGKGYAQRLICGNVYIPVTRWNSLAILFQSMVDLEIPLSAALGMLHQFQLNLVREEWNFVKKALKVIHPMYKITHELSSQKYTILHIYFKGL